MIDHEEPQVKEALDELAQSVDAPITSTPEPEAVLPEKDFFADSLTAREMERELMELLPGGSQSAEVQYRNIDRAPEEEPGSMRGYLQMDLDTGAGFGGLELIIYPPELVLLGPPEGSDSTILTCQPEAVRCFVTITKQGDVSAIQIELLLDGVTLNLVKVRTQSGSIVSLAVSNSANRKVSGPPTTEDPPLTLAECW